LLLFLLLLLLSRPVSSADYDTAIKAAAERYLPWQWQWLKAQLYQESLLDPNAESPAGAVGIAQFMPATWAEVSRKLSINGSPRDAYHAINAAAYYDARLRRIWKSDRPECDRRNLTFASYNAGAGNILKAQRYCKWLAWPHIAQCLSRVTGRHANETTTYVKRIRNHFLRFYGVCEHACDSETAACYPGRPDC